MRKKILVIAPQSYPVTDAEAIVNAKMLQAMSHCGSFEIDLVSKKDKWKNYTSDSIENLGIKLNKIHIIEVDNKINLLTIFQHIWSLLYFGVVFKGCHWAFAALPIIKKLIKENQYDYVLTKNSPSLLLGYYLKKKYGVKWVATWNDPYPGIKYPSPYGAGWDSKESLIVRRLINVMRKADVHIFPSDRIRDYMLKYLKINKKSTLILPHVILNKDVSTEEKEQYGALKIIHSGNLKSPRNPRNFLLALSRLLKENPEIDIEVTFQGVFDDDLIPIINDLGIAKFIKFRNSVSYSESLKLLKNYDIALIIEADCEEGIFLPTKVSDFLQCGKTIFAISPRIGVLNDLFRNSVISYFATVSDSEEIYKELKRMCGDYLANKKNNVIGAIPKIFTEDYIVKEYMKL